uniref:SEA domain-containing protein n=1 Tax=Leptobrachium leishanense TaxID=445787 RepID=A0A8C5M2Z0_9ANUR
MKNTSIGQVYNQCQVMEFRSANSAGDTKLDAICSYNNNSASPAFDSIAFYKELSSKTNTITNLGIYSLDPNNLYVNGYNEKIPTAPTPLVNSFTLNLTLTNLMHTSDLGMPASLKFNNTKAIISNMLDTVIKNTSLAPSYTGCEIKEFRSAAGGRSTKVNSVCTFISTSSAPSFDRVSFYKEMSKQTNNITKLGIYSVDPSSLYVNEYNEPLKSVESPIVAATVPSVEATNSEKITLNFTILNMPYTSDLGTINSGKFNSTAAVVVYLLDTVFKNSSVKSTYTKCIIDSFVSDLSGTKVNSICTIRRDTTNTPFDKEAFYKEMETLTKGVSTLGSYKLDKNSLYVNGYNESPKATTIKPLTNVTTASVFGPRHFFINFTITNLNHTSKLENKTSEQYMKIENLLNQLLNKIFKNTSFKDKFMNCSVTGFRSTPPFPYTTAESVCVFNVDLLAKAPIEEDILNAFINGTEDGSSLGNFTLQKLSIHIDPYISDVSTQPPSTNVGAAATTTTTTTAIPMLSSADLGFNINYTIINQYVPSDPEAKMKMQLEIEQAMNKLYQNSSLARKFKFCKLAQMRNGSIIASCNCYFEDDPIINKQSVEKEFYNGTITGKLLGSDFLLKDITVAEIPKDNDLPFWAIILICLAVLFGLVLLFLCIFALAFCLKKKKGFYDFPQSIYGTYFPHLDMRKLY